ncbi:hypothetical protein HG530_002883 [Fusarium avenaceum]|nr:hypothetical protein HG530_002883 [Fusarium avenaceum]
MQTICLLRWGRQSLMKHHGNKSLDSLCDGLILEIVDVRRAGEERLGECEDGFCVCFDHSATLVACQVSEALGQLLYGSLVRARGRSEKLHVLRDELIGILARSSKVEQLKHVEVCIVKEVRPIGICLHETKLSDLAETESQNLRANPIALLLSKRGDASHANTVHKVHVTFPAKFQSCVVNSLVEVKASGEKLGCCEQNAEVVKI